MARPAARPVLVDLLALEATWPAARAGAQDRQRSTRPGPGRGTPGAPRSHSRLHRRVGARSLPGIGALRHAQSPFADSSLGAITVPTLFIAGTEDRLFPVGLAREQAGAIPGARFETVPGTAHQSLWESPEQVLPRLRAFISEIEGATGTQSENRYGHRQSQIE